jgi:predicted Rossmann fold nucleotide-binding protein DprA/Smf involved in DNA uptake
VGEGLGEGCNQLIADGAAVMTGPGDLVKALDREEKFLEPWPLQHGGAPSPWPQMSPMRPLCQEDEAVVEIFESGEILDLDTLRMRSGLPVHALVARLLSLEISGRVEKTLANTYRLTR